MLDHKNPADERLERAPAPGAKLAPLTQLSLRSDKITIGPILPEDTAALFLWLNDVESVNLDIAYRPIDWLHYNNWLEGFSKNPTQVIFAIRHIHDPRIIGFAGLTKLDLVHRSAEFGVRIGSEENRGKGYGREAARLALQYAWNHANLHRVYLSVFDFNRRAIAAYRAAGFQYEGKQRQAAFINGRWTDVVLMAALRDGN